MSEVWTQVCKQEDLVKNSGVCALIEGQQVALFCIPTSAANDAEMRIVATSNWDPIGKANVLYRGLLGSKHIAEASTEDDTVYFVCSPLYKQRYCLATGRCLDNQDVAIDIHQVKLENNSLFVKLAS